MMTLAEAGQPWGLTRERVRSVQNAMLRDLRRLLYKIADRGLSVDEYISNPDKGAIPLPRKNLGLQWKFDKKRTNTYAAHSGHGLFQVSRTKYIAYHAGRKLHAYEIYLNGHPITIQKPKITEDGKTPARLSFESCMKLLMAAQGVDIDNITWDFTEAKKACEDYNKDMPVPDGLPAEVIEAITDIFGPVPGLKALP